MSVNETASKQVINLTTKAGNAVALADLPVLAGNELSSSLLVDAVFYEYGQLLLVKLADGRLLVVQHFFTSAADLGLPADLVSGDSSVSMLLVEANTFNQYLDGLAGSAIFKSVTSKLADVPRWVADAQATNDQQGQSLFGDSGTETTVAVQGDNTTDTGGGLYSASGLQPGLATGSLLDDNTASAGTDTSGLGSLSTLSLGGLGGGTAPGLSGVGGTLGSADNLAFFTPPSDSFASNTSGVEDEPEAPLAPAPELTPIFFFPPLADGVELVPVQVAPADVSLEAVTTASQRIIATNTVELSLAELNYRYAGQGDVITIYGSGTEPQVSFENPANWYVNSEGNLTSLDATGMYSSARFLENQFYRLNDQPIFSSFDISIAGLEPVSIDLTGVTVPHEELAAVIAANPTLSAAGIKVYWNFPDGVNDLVGDNDYINDFGSLVITDPGNREIISATITRTTRDGNLTPESLIIENNIQVVNYTTVIQGAEHNITQYPVALYEPPADVSLAFVAEPTQRIILIGESAISLADLNYRYSGQGSTIFIYGSGTEPVVNFAVPGNWVVTNDSYLTSIEASGQFSVARFNESQFYQFTGEPIFTSFTISITGIGTVNVDLTGVSVPHEELAAIISADPILSAAGISAYWNIPDGVNTDTNVFGSLVVADPFNREITEAFITRPTYDGGTFDTALDIEADIPLVNYIVPLEGIDHNITQFRILGSNFTDESFVIDSAGDPDFIALSAGVDDYDTLSFINDFDLVTGSAYTKISGVSHLDARNNGDNVVTVNQDVVLSVTENDRILDVSGDNGDQLVFTDAATWIYNGIINNNALISNIILEGSGDIVGSTVVAPATIERFGNIQYQYTSQSGGETLYINVSADILNHPDWYWFGGTSGDDAYELPDTQFGSVDFGDGIDTLEINSGLANRTQDFSSEGGDLANVEIINFENIISTPDGSGGASSDDIILDRAFVAGATDSNNTLSIIGDSVDSVTVTDIATDWTFLGTVAGTEGLTGYTFNQYAYRPDETGEVILNIESEIAGLIPNYYRGWEGDDIITIQPGNFAGIEGGAGRDTALFADAGSTRAIDVTATTTINSIEILDLRNSNDENLTFDLSGVGRADNDTIFVLGDAGVDSVDVTNSGDWTLAGRANITDAPDMYVYQGSGGELLYVQTSLLQDFERLAVATSGDDLFRVIDTDFGALNGGAGNFDRINFLQDGNIDLANLGGSSLTSVEVADLTNGVANNLSLSAASIDSAAQSGTFYVLGENGDSLTLSAGDNWQFQGSFTINADLTLNGYTSTAAGGTTVYVDSQVTTSIA